MLVDLFISHNLQYLALGFSTVTFPDTQAVS